ncbi:MAG: diguanylate cyclase [Pseudomonadota bacterium]
MRLGRRSRGAIVSLALAGAMAAPLAAQQPLAFNRIDGLGAGSQSIISLLQDRQGFIWIGTVEGGLFRYDGTRALNFQNDPADPRSLPGGRAAALWNDEQGRIWVGTDEGLARFEPGSQGFTRFVPESGPKNFRIVRHIVADGKGGMWLGTWGGLQHFDPASGRFIVHQHDAARADSLAHNDVGAVTLDDKGGVWVGTWPGGLDYLPPGASAFQHFRVDEDEQPNPKRNVVRSLHYDSAGKLWIGTDAGVVVWKAGRPWSERRALDGIAGRVTHIDEDMSGDLWLSTRTAGLYRWDRETRQLQAYQHRAEDRHSLPTNAINSTLHDRSGTLWVGSFTDGVSRANLGNHGFERFIPRDIAPDRFKASNFVRSLGAAPDGKLWMGVDDGLMLFDPAARQVLRQYSTQSGGLSNNVVYSLYQQPDGPLWAGTAQGLNRLDSLDATFRTVHFGSGGADFINRIAPGRGGILWLGTSNSLLRYDPASGDVQSFAHDEANPDSRGVDGVTTLLEDRAGRVWTGEFFRGGGLDVRDPASGKFRHLRHDPINPASLSSDRVTCLHEDAGGALWVGTIKGVNRVTVGAGGKLEVKRYPRLGKLMVEAIQSDRVGMIWVSTVAGLSKLDPFSETATSYSLEDGLTDGFYLDSSVRGSDARLYFGSISGITAVNPAIHSSVSRPPQLAITDISIFKRSLAGGAALDGVRLDGSVTEPKALTLPWNASALSIAFAALHYAEPRRNGYVYKLEGFDQDWVKADASQPLATYTNLYPGNYRFRLMVSNNKGVESRNELVLPIVVTPPFWQTWWLRAGVLAVLLGLLLALYRWRVRRLTGWARLLEAQVAERTGALQESNRKLAALSATDSLTGIANRRSFDDALAREWRRAARNHETLAVAMLDVDYFKLYNDHYGHQAGDACLSRVAQVLAAGMHRPGDMVARYGGEEFAFIAPATSGPDALRVADRVRAELAALALPHVESPFGHVTASIGVAVLVPGQDGAPELLLRAADQALYAAKHQGRNRAVLADPPEVRR